MIQAILLYGSKARNDGERDSDTDLLGISTGGPIAKHHEDVGVSFHVYPLPWMLEHSARGSLFLSHITHEAVPLFDPEDTLSLIKNSFSFKKNYRQEIEVGIRILSAIGNLKPESFSERIRTRYFWGLRTAIMGAAANEGLPLFSSKALEEFCDIDGLALHIQNRQTAPINACKQIAQKVVSNLSALAPDVLMEDTTKNLLALFAFGGVAAATAGEIHYGF
jgi:hypothetical protein